MIPMTDVTRATALVRMTADAARGGAPAAPAPAPAAPAAAPHGPSGSAPAEPAPSELAQAPFVSVADMMRLVHRIGVEDFLTRLADRIEADFLRWDAFDKTPRIPAHSDVGVIELMPTTDGARYGFKYVNGHPQNTKTGRQTVTAFGVLADMKTGYPLMLSEMTVLTALRTAATSAMAAKHLAPKGARCMAIIGNGAQSEFQALAMKAVCGIDRLRLYDIDPAASARCAKNLAGQGLQIEICGSAQEAVQGAQIITTVTADKKNAVILSDNMVGAGVHLNAVGGDCPGKTELAEGVVRRAGIFVEYPPQTRIEGEIQQLPEDHPVTELHDVVAGRAPGRRDAAEVTLFDSVGFAIEDFSALNMVYEALPGSGCFQMLDLMADPDEPRDLYGMLMRAKG